MTTVPKDAIPLIRKAEAEGWEVKRTTKNHVILISPQGQRVGIGGTPRNVRRYIARLRTDLRRAGLDLD